MRGLLPGFAELSAMVGSAWEPGAFELLEGFAQLHVPGVAVLAAAVLLCAAGGTAVVLLARARARSLAGRVHRLQKALAAAQRSEADLRNRGARLQAVLDNTDAVVYVKDLAGRYLLANRRFSELFALEHGEILGRTDYDLFSREVAEAFRANDAAVVSEGVPKQSQEVAPHPDGLHSYVSIKFPLRDGEGRIYAVGGISTDINDQIRVQQALRESESRLRTLFEGVDDAIFVHDEAGRIIDCNEAACRRLGYTREELLKLHTRDIDAPEFAAGFGERLERQLSQGRYACEGVHVARDGRRIPVHVNTSTIEYDGRQAVLAVIRDITDRKEAEETLAAHAAELERLNDELQQTNEHLDQFAYVASHDLQEPLRTLVTYADFLGEDLGASASGEVRNDLDTLKSAARRMQALVRDLLAFSRSSRQEMTMVAVPLDGCVDQALHNIEHRLKETGAVIERDPLPVVRGDATLLAQLYQNLLSNALKFHGAGAPRIRLTAERDGDRWVCGVRDNGIGIAPEYAEQIFSPFRRLHSTREYEGTGIGLAICHKVVERHGGRIWVESEPGDGAHFRFVLEAANEAEA